MNNYKFHATQDAERREFDAKHLSGSGHIPLSNTAYRQLKNMKNRKDLGETFRYRLNLALEREYITSEQYEELKK